MKQQDPSSAADKVLDALIAELLRARIQDPPLGDEDIRRLRIEGRP